MIEPSKINLITHQPLFIEPFKETTEKRLRYENAFYNLYKCFLLNDIEYSRKDLLFWGIFTAPKLARIYLRRQEELIQEKSKCLHEQSRTGNSTLNVELSNIHIKLLKNGHNLRKLEVKDKEFQAIFKEEAARITSLVAANLAKTSTEKLLFWSKKPVMVEATDIDLVIDSVIHGNFTPPSKLWRDENGQTLLHIACQNPRNSSIVNLLLQIGYNPLTEDKDKLTPLHHCLVNKDKRMTKLLLSSIRTKTDRYTKNYLNSNIINSFADLKDFTIFTNELCELLATEGMKYSDTSKFKSMLQSFINIFIPKKNQFGTLLADTLAAVHRHGIELSPADERDELRSLMSRFTIDVVSNMKYVIKTYHQCLTENGFAESVEKTKNMIIKTQQQELEKSDERVQQLEGKILSLQSKLEELSRSKDTRREILYSLKQEKKAKEQYATVSSSSSEEILELANVSYDSDSKKQTKGKEPV